MFDTHPGVDVVFIAADGMPFLEDSAAHSHAQRLFDKNVLEISREDLDDYDPATFADGLGDEIAAPGTPLHPSIAGPYNEFLQSEGGNALESGSVIVPPSNILAHEEYTPAVGGGIDQLASVLKSAISASLAAAADIAPEPVLPTVETPVLNPLAIAYGTPEAERTPYQKGLITKAENADKAAAEKGETN